MLKECRRNITRTDMSAHIKTSCTAMVVHGNDRIPAFQPNDSEKRRVAFQRCHLSQVTFDSKAFETLMQRCYRATHAYCRVVYGKLLHARPHKSFGSGFPCYTSSSKAFESNVICLKWHLWVAHNVLQSHSVEMPLQPKAHDNSCFRISKAFETRTFLLWHAVSSCRIYKNNYLRVKFAFYRARY